MKNEFDYIIIGAGCAGLSLLMRILDQDALSQKRILLIDRSAKSANDRTWCFWEKGSSYFEPLVCKRWDSLWVKHDVGALPLQMDGYAYKMIRALDFYTHAAQRIADNTRVTQITGEVTAIDAAAGTVQVGNTLYQGQYVFSAALPAAPVLGKKDIYLLQHFRGWWVETDSDFFDPAQADLMNFRTSQEHGCAFMYMLPITPRKALIEYTLFSPAMLSHEQYNEGLAHFIKTQLKLNHYHITEVENGVIPMTTYRFPVADQKVIYIGTASGQTKASTGYTFQFIQQHSTAITNALVQQQQPASANRSPWRFSFYDAILLRVLQDKMASGADIFYQLFQKNKAARVWRFLDNASHFGEELFIMQSVPQGTFIRAGWRQFVS